MLLTLIGSFSTGLLKRKIRILTLTPLRFSKGLVSCEVVKKPLGKTREKGHEQYIFDNIYAL